MRLQPFIAALALSLLCAHPATVAGATQPQKIFLWPEGAPGVMPNGGEETVRVTEQGDHVVSNVHRPSLTVYLPKGKHRGSSVIVVPGGGHRELWTDHEGHNVARFLAERGFAAFVLEYRLARAPNSTYSIEGDALNDLKRAIRTVRSRPEWAADTRQIGAMGFSAGGQLVALAATRADTGDAAAIDLIDRASSKLDAAALIYPGTWPDLKIAADTPPMFLLCGGDDRPEVIAGITNLYLKLREAKVRAELHIYDGVPHGFGLRASLSGPVSHWPQVFVDWVKGP
ncbi:MAG: alpha/beta hydrolase [Pseudomonadota bacterium]